MGKSSLLNAVLGRKDLLFTSKKAVRNFSYSHVVVHSGFPGSYPNSELLQSWPAPRQAGCRRLPRIWFTRTLGVGRFI